jgi:hypothetical protein
MLPVADIDTISPALNSTPLSIQQPLPGTLRVTVVNAGVAVAVTVLVGEGTVAVGTGVLVFVAAGGVWVGFNAESMVSGVRLFGIQAFKSNTQTIRTA